MNKKQVIEEDLQDNKYFIGDGEYNLARMRRKLIIDALNKYSDLTLAEIAAKIGMSERQFCRSRKELGIKTKIIFV